MFTAHCRSVFALGLALCAFTNTANAQILYGTIVGSVKDPSDTAVAGAQVTITNQSTNQSREGVTDAEGSFSFPTVQSGLYTIRVSRDGFQTNLRRDVALSINSTVRADVALQVGAVSETVSVSAQAQALQTDRTEVRGELTTKTPHFANPSNNISNLQLTNGAFTRGVFEITGITNTGREQGDERAFRLGLRLQF